MSIDRQAKEDIEEQKRLTRQLFKTIIVIQVCMISGTYLFLPYYFVPFINNFYGRFACVLFTIWQVLGLTFFWKNSVKSTRVAAAVFFCGPLTLCTLLGPALLRALGMP